MQRTVDSHLDLLFTPRSIALIGASNKPGKMGNLFAQKLRQGFAGDLVAVNPGETEVAGIESYPSVSALPLAVDVMITLVPGNGLVDLLESCPAGSARFVVAVPSGFAEISDTGRSLQNRLAAAAKARGMRLLGPNTVGFMNSEIGLNASMIPLSPPGGGRGVACLTQSGGFGMALAMYAVDHGLTLSKFCDVGNMADIDIETVLTYLSEDCSTAVIGLFLESVRDPVSFHTALKEAARRKPVVLATVGRSQAGMASSRAHLGLEPNAGALADALPAGVYAAPTGLDLIDACKVLLWQEARGQRLAIITGTGGIGGELADLAVADGLTIPRLSASLQAELRNFLPAYAGVANPIDVTPIWWQYPDVYPALIRLIDASGEVDMILASITDVATTLPALPAAIAALYRQGLRSSLLVYWGSRDQDLAGMRPLEDAGVPCFTSTAAAARAAGVLGHARR